MTRQMVLNGRFVPEDEAAISPVDRGFQFAESVYEVIRIYGGRPFEIDRHLRRFRASAAAIGLSDGYVTDTLGSQALELLARVGDKEALLYMQVSSGAAPRSHLRPEGLTPTTIAKLMSVPPVPAPWVPQQLTAMTVPDERWAQCHIKTTMLLVNTTAKRRAVAEGHDDAIFIRDGFVTEATAANVFAVIGGVLCTPPKSNYILHGITREVLLELAAEAGVPVVEGPIHLLRLREAEEVIMTATAFEVASVTRLDGKTVGNGEPGPVARKLVQRFQKRATGE